LILCSAAVESKINIQTSEQKELLSQEIYEKITKEHFFKDKNVTNINSEIFKLLLKQLDSQKIYFTKYEVDSFQKEFRAFDSSVTSKIRTTNNIDLASFYELVNLYFNRLAETTNYQIREVKKNRFNFEKDESLQIDYEDAEWKKNKFLLRETWKKLAKNDVLTSMLAEKDTSEAVKAIKKRYQNRLRRIMQRNEEDVFSIVMNNMTAFFDPHSSYFSPKSAEDFEMTMSLKLEGIGALLTTEDDYPVIVSVIPGGPAEKTGKINPDDKIVKITQVETPRPESVDVVGWRIDEVVQLIRGESGTQVELEIIPAKTEDFSDRKFVTITREEVKLEEQAAKSSIIVLEQNSQMTKIGIIDLPAFYIDFNAWRNRDPNYRSSSKDVEKILEDFNSQNVDGVVIDLRSNSGGSLYEANKLTGLFIASGATLQVKESNGSVRPWGDARAKQAWIKPMAVMVNRYSASASEIFAGAIQDYQRGIIIGQRTFGKGTVQKLDSLSSGQLKVTESKFYRVSGSGMQNKGIEPDIVLPSSWDIEEIGESSLDSALPWDQIKPVRFKRFKMNKDLISDIKNLHIDRVNKNPNLKYILDIRDRYEAQKNKKTLSLNIKKREQEKYDRQDWSLNTENKRRSGLDLEIFNSYQDLKDFNENKEDNETDIDIEKDYLLKEGAQILYDYMLLSKNNLITKAA
jgi:carboxyl-terminal processing protease